MVMNMEPNEQQKKLITSTEGIYLVDAGAGTGKTFALTRRYAYILNQQDVEPEDLLLVTFTNNAAEEMEKKVLNLCRDYKPIALRKAPICTFHSLCNRLIREHGFRAPQLLGIDDRITTSTRIVDNEALEEQAFRRFMNRFMVDNPQYRDFYRIVYDHLNLLNLIKKLASKGVFPTNGGWYQNGEKYLDGDFEKFKRFFEKANEIDKNRQSELKYRLSGYRNKCFPAGAPEETEVRGSGCKQIPSEMAERAFLEDREELKEFIHDLYFEYIRYVLARNYLNFNFLLMFAYVLLCEDHELHEENTHRYVMVDEFQDTSEIQLKLTLLLADRPNLCAVGDWKQSIYSFQYADVDNIRQFEERLDRFKQELNEDYPRIDYQIGGVEKIPFEKNYRSTQEILDFSEQSLTLEATHRETLDKKEIMGEVVSLKSNGKMSGPTRIEAVKGEREHEIVLQKIQEIVNSSHYLVGEDGGLREAIYSDIVVLTRLSKFGLELQKEARKYGIPLVYEGGTELFKTDPAILLLAWLRILNFKHSKRGWSVILEHAGHNLDEVRQILYSRHYPEKMVRFRKELEEADGVSAVARMVFKRYGISNVFADKIVEVLQRIFENSYMNLGRLIQFIEDNIRSSTRYDVDGSGRENVVKVRTIHAEKGLEHPIVFISNINQSRFPSTRRGGARIDYREPVGIRQKKIFLKTNPPYLYDNWRTEILHKCLSGQYDEERRLMYVAMTRAKRHLIFTSDTEKSSRFFENLNIQPVEIEPELQKIEVCREKLGELEIEKPCCRTPIKRTAHSLMNLTEDVGKGKEYGREVHLFAERYASGEDIEGKNIDEENVKEFVDNLEGRLTTEEVCFLPLEKRDRGIVLKGVIDLIQEDEDTIDIIDYKTDRGRVNEGEYRKQLSVYYHVLNELHEDNKVSVSIFYTANGERVEIEPLTREELEGEV